MGFPVGCSELILPKFLVNLVFLLGTIRRFLIWALSAVGLGDLLDTAPDVPRPSSSAWSIPHSGSHHRHGHQGARSVSASLILESLPVAPYEKCCEGEEEEEKEGESCVVCLYEFEGGEEVRRLSNCRHVFHRCCIDPWVELDQRTCPLCRTPLIPEEMRSALDQKISSSGEFYSEFYYGDDGDYYPLLDDSLDLIPFTHDEIISLPPISQFAAEIR